MKTKGKGSGDFVSVNGDCIVTELRKAKMTQKALSEKVGITRFRMSNLCQPGLHRVRASTADNIAEVFNLPVSALQSEEVHDAETTEVRLSELEFELLRMYRALPPKEKIALLNRLQNGDVNRQLVAEQPDEPPPTATEGS